MTPSQKGLQGTLARFLRRFWLTERATPTQKHLQGTIIRFLKFGLFLRGSVRCVRDGE